MRSLIPELRAAFVEAYGDRSAPQFAFAPGRANLMGEHTDYNDGWVLPMAIDRYVGVAFSPRDDGRICTYSPAFQERYCLETGELSPGKPKGWAGYVAGVIWAIRCAGMYPQGMNMVVQGQIPMGAGLSSSAALEMAVARAVCEVSGLPWDPARMAELGQQAEREYAGVSCGIMDQFASAISAPGCALLLDCRSLATEPVPIPPGVSVPGCGAPSRPAHITSATAVARKRSGSSAGSTRRCVRCATSHPSFWPSSARGWTLSPFAARATWLSRIPAQRRWRRRCPPVTCCELAA